MSSDNCIECQRERAALAAAALGQHPVPVMTAQFQQHHNRQGGDACLVNHPGMGGGTSSGVLTPATSTIMSMSSNPPDNHSSCPTPSGGFMQNYYGGIPPSSVGGPGGAPNMHALRGAMVNTHQSGSSSPMNVGGHNKQHGGSSNAHYVDHVNNNHSHQQQQTMSGVCPPVAANAQYHQLANNDYTKLDDSISGMYASQLESSLVVAMVVAYRI